MTINDISKELGLTKRAIKFYEEKGLLSVPKDENGYRNYSQEHIRPCLKKEHALYYFNKRAIAAM